MNFDWALQKMREGKKVRRRASYWTLYLSDDKTKIYSSYKGTNLDIMRVENILANDWEEYMEPGHDWAWACQQMLEGKTVFRGTRSFRFGSNYLADKSGWEVFLTREDLESKEWRVE